MTRSLPMMLIGLVFGTLAGFLFAAANGITLDGHDHATDHGAVLTPSTSQASGHDHTQLIQLAAENAPSIRVILHADPAGGWNLEVQTSHFRFAPEHVSQAHIDGEGHAHVYVNDVKVARLYGNWFQLPSVVSGDIVRVALFSNDHKGLSVNGDLIQAQVTVP